MLTRPDLARDEDEKAEMDACDVVSKAIAGGGSFKPGDHEQYEGDDDDDDDEDEDDEDDDEYDSDGSGSGAPAPIFGFGAPAFAAQPPPAVVPPGAMVDQFTAVTGADTGTATRVLAGALGRGLGLENAVSFYFERLEAGIPM